MVRRLKSLDRSRRTPVLARRMPVRPPVPSPAEPAAGPTPTSEPADAIDAVATPPAPAFPPPTLPQPAASPPPTALPTAPPTALPVPPVPAPAAEAARAWPTPPSATGHAPTGWDWFAQWPFPSQLFVFSVFTAAGMWWLDRPVAPVPEAADPPPIIRPAENRRARIRPETFDWLNRLRETQVVNDQLEAEFTQAQEFFREYALDEFLDFDPWVLGSDEVIALSHFCDQGFFTVEREILIKILERRVFDRTDAGEATPQGASARLESAVRDRESRLASLQEAAEMYRRGRTAEVTIPGALTPEDDQAQRAQLVDKLASVRRARALLDARIEQLNVLLR